MSSLTYPHALVKAVARNLIQDGALQRIKDYCAIHEDQLLVTIRPDRCAKCLAALIDEPPSVETIYRIEAEKRAREVREAKAGS